MVLRELDISGLKMNFEECKFYQNEVLYVGYKINLQGIEMDGHLGYF